MDIIELSQNKPIEIVEAFKNTPVNNCMKSINKEVIKTRIITDGKIGVASVKTRENVQEFKIDNVSYDVDFLETQRIFLKNYTYIIKYLILCGKEEKIQKILVYLQSINDKETLTFVKKTIEMLKKCDSRFNFANLYDTLTSDFNSGLDMLNKNVYVLKK